MNVACQPVVDDDVFDKNHFSNKAGAQFLWQIGEERRTKKCPGHCKNQNTEGPHVIGAESIQAQAAYLLQVGRRTRASCSCAEHGAPLVMIQSEAPRRKFKLELEGTVQVQESCASRGSAISHLNSHQHILILSRLIMIEITYF